MYFFDFFFSSFQSKPFVVSSFCFVVLCIVNLILFFLEKLVILRVIFLYLLLVLA